MKLIENWLPPIIGVIISYLIYKCDVITYNGSIEFIEGDLISYNDGLTRWDWCDWFKNYDLSKPMAIIQFTKFRY